MGKEITCKKKSIAASSGKMKLSSQQTQTSAGQSVQLFQAGSPSIPHFHTHPAAMTWPGCDQDHGHASGAQGDKMQDHGHASGA